MDHSHFRELHTLCNRMEFCDRQAHIARFHHIKVQRNRISAVRMAGDRLDHCVFAFAVLFHGDGEVLRECVVAGLIGFRVGARVKDHAVKDRILLKIDFLNTAAALSPPTYLK